MSLMLWLSLVLVCLLGAMSPGPSLVVVLRETVVNGRIHGVVAGVAHACGVAIWALLTINGLALIVTEHQMLFRLISWAGAAYLAWMGFQAWRHAGKGAAFQTPTGKPHTLWQTARSGFLISMMNPKLALFFTALFSQFVTADQSISVHAILVATAAIIDGGWYALVAMLLSHPRLLAGLRNRAVLVERLAGTLLIGLAVRVITLR